MGEKFEKKIIPIFYASDENYLPFLTISAISLKEHASRDYQYRIYVLNADIDTNKTKKLKEQEEDWLKIQFVNVAKQIESIKNALQLRDYYTGTTYYRIFIAEMFPEYEKALYIDSDTIFLDDVSKLFNVQLGENYVGAIPDEAVASVKEFSSYTKEVLGIEANKYFNAGVLLINLKKCREEGFYKRFCDLLSRYKFSVAQDQDYLNVICKDKVCYIDKEWNRMPIGGKSVERPKLIHYNLTLKPWHYENILYQEYFWEYARNSAYYDEVRSELDSYSKEQKDKDARSEKILKQLCLDEIAREDNYYKAYLKKHTKGEI